MDWDGVFWLLFLLFCWTWSWNQRPVGASFFSEKKHHTHLPLQKLPWEESHWKNSSVTPPKFQKSTNKSQIGYVDDFFLWRSMFGFLVPFLVGLNGCTSRLFTSNFLRHSKNVSSTRCGENPKNCMGIWWRFSRIPRPSKGVKFHPRGLFLVFFLGPKFQILQGFRIQAYIYIYIVLWLVLMHFISIAYNIDDGLLAVGT